jgi:hypothetical protein
MAVKIGHASLDERGKASGGTAGDQTGKEVTTRNWYAKGWNVVLRPKSAVLAEKSALACEAACANPNIGYDQGGRNTLHAKAAAVGYDLAAIAEKCECDCSSLMHVCAIAGGANLSYGANGHTTSTMVREYLNSGDYIKLTDGKYLTGDKYLRRGDILVKEGSHTAMALEDGEKAGTAQGKYTPDLVAIHYSVRLPMLVRGMKSDAVWAMQQLLMARGYELPEHGADGDFGEETENALMRYQENMNIAPDGKCGPETWSALLGLTGVG